MKFEEEKTYKWGGLRRPSVNVDALAITHACSDLLTSDDDL